MLRRHHENPEEPDPHASPLKRAVLDATARVQQIIDVAEEAAKEVRTEAERDAERIVADAQTKSDSLVASRVAELGQRLAPLVRRLEGVQADVSMLSAEIDTLLQHARETSPSAPPAAAGEEPAAGFERRGPFDHINGGPQPSHEGVDDHADSEPEAPTDIGASRAFLRATQMAVAGSERDEIEQTLRSEFGVDEPAQIVDRALGIA